jgi:hypothetical protein
MSKFTSFVALTLFALGSPDVARFHAAEDKKEPEPKLLEPTAEQLAAAKEAFAKHGAVYEASRDPAMKRAFLTVHVFSLRGNTTDTDLNGLPDPPFYFALTLSSTKVTVKGMKELRNLRNLTFLDLSETDVTDEVLKELNVLTNLRYLSLKHTKVTDDGLKELKNLEKLRELILRSAKNVKPRLGLTETPVTDAGVAELQRALPRCHIYY